MRLALLFWLAFVGPALAQDLEQAFRGYQATFVSYDTLGGRWQILNSARSEQRFSPCSTFKLPNSLIVLEAGAVADEETVVAWDGVKRRFPDWNRDQTLRTALAVSALWVYQKLAQHIPPSVYAGFLNELNYGNQDLSGGAAAPFWQMSSLTVSAREQVAFLRRLESGEVPFSERNQEIVRRIMVLRRGEGWVLRGKTGSGVSADGTRLLGWFVGYASRGPRSLIFAANLEGPNQPSTEPGGWTARRIVDGILRSQGWIGP